MGIAAASPRQPSVTISPSCWLPAPSVKILEQAFPVRLAFALAAQKRQQVTRAVAPHSVSHQHVHVLAPRRTPHPQAHSVQKQIGVVVAQPPLMKWRTASSRSRVSLDTVCALTTSPVNVATTRSSCRVEMPRRNASRISMATPRRKLVAAASILPGTLYL